jgi:hypothetical protein
MKNTSQHAEQLRIHEKLMSSKFNHGHCDGVAVGASETQHASDSVGHQVSRSNLSGRSGRYLPKWSELR